MPYKVEFNQFALVEYEHAFEYYDNIRPDLADSFMSAVERTYQRIATAPEQYPKVNRIFRQAIVEDFPYTVTFNFIQREKLIYIASVRHMSQSNRGKFRRRVT